MAIHLIVGQGVTPNRIFLRKCARWSTMPSISDRRASLRRPSMRHAASMMVSATPAPCRPCHSPAAREARACGDANVMLRDHTWPKRSTRAMSAPRNCSTVRRDGRIHAPGRLHIGGCAYCGWALPPKAGGTAHRHGQVHPHTTSLRIMAKRL